MNECFQIGGEFRGTAARRGQYAYNVQGLRSPSVKKKNPKNNKNKIKKQPLKIYSKSQKKSKIQFESYNCFLEQLAIFIIRIFT